MNNGKITPQDSFSLGAEMQAYCDEVIEQVMEQREEILEAFVAQHGFKPDEAMQVHEGNSFCVVRMEPEKVVQMQRSMIVAKISRGKLTRWQRLCLWAAGYGGGK